MGVLNTKAVVTLVELFKGIQFATSEVVGHEYRLENMPTISSIIAQRLLHDEEQLARRHL